MSTITLTTDFGLADWYVGAMKGVIRARAPAAQAIDLTHQVAPGNIRQGALALRCAYAYFPEGTVHVAVVDPGVGGPRPPLAARSRRFGFVGPDNGVLALALAAEGECAVRRIENPALILPKVGNTFHGRDVFAPVAAALAAGLDFAEVGPEAADWTRLPWPEPRRWAWGWAGEVVHVDRFGNALTNLPSRLIEGFAPAQVRVRLPRGRTCPVGSCYAAVAPGRAVAVPGSSGFLEVAVRDGQAAPSLGLRAGAPVRLAIGPAR
jgi:S-adenosylmethionine hydrolase